MAPKELHGHDREEHDHIEPIGEASLEEHRRLEELGAAEPEAGDADSLQVEPVADMPSSVAADLAEFRTNDSADFEVPSAALVLGITREQWRTILDYYNNGSMSMPLAIERVRGKEIAAAYRREQHNIDHPENPKVRRPTNRQNQKKKRVSSGQTKIPSDQEPTQSGNIVRTPEEIEKARLVGGAFQVPDKDGYWERNRQRGIELGILNPDGSFKEEAA